MVLISLGALVGKVNSLQLLIIALLETIAFSINEMICLNLLEAADYGRSMVVHLFGAVFGMVVSRMIFSKKICTSRALSMSYKSEMYALIGQCFRKLFLLAIVLIKRNLVKCCDELLLYLEVGCTIEMATPYSFRS